jgi:hypothetical protein
MLIYEMALRVRLYMSSTKPGKSIADFEPEKPFLIKNRG